MGQYSTQSNAGATAGKGHATAVIAVVLALSTALLVWHGVVRLNDFKRYQLELVKHSVRGAAEEISSFIRHRRLAVANFAKNYRGLIQHLALNPDDVTARVQLEGEVAEHFPYYFAVTIADSQGHALLGNFDLLVNEICERDIQTYVTGGAADVYIHPHVKAYHFDIMAPWEGVAEGGAQAAGGVLLVSFKPTLLARMLGNAQIHRHELMLLKREPAGLIEVTARGARIDLQELDGNFILTPDQLTGVLYRMPVEETLWELVDRPDPGVVREETYRIWTQTLAIFLVFVSIDVLLLVFLRREEHRRRASECALRHATEQLRSALDFSNVSTWELDMPSRRFHWSENAAAIFGADMPTRFEEYLQLLDVPDRKRMRLAIEQCKREATACHLEHRITASDGAVRWVEMTGNLEPFKRTDPHKMIGLITDISARKQAEQDRLDQEKKQRDTLIKEVHHRIKNNLQGVVGLLRQHSTKHPEQSEVLDKAAGQLYSVSAIYGLQSDDAHGEVSLDGLLDEICQATERMTGARIDYRRAPACQHGIRLNRDNAVAVALILNELVFNSVKHSPRDRTVVATAELSCNAERATVAIANQDAALDDGFSFERQIGTGTGLALVRSLLPKSGANLDIREADGGVRAELVLAPPVLRGKNDDSAGSQ